MLQVRFPDGSTRNVTGQLRAMPGADGRDCFVQIPVNCDPVWRFVSTGDGWKAVPRHAPQVRRLVPRAGEWWSGIAPMCDVHPAITENNVAA